jgi:hypothetical protein
MMLAGDSGIICAVESNIHKDKMRDIESGSTKRLDARVILGCVGDSKVVPESI